MQTGEHKPHGSNLRRGRISEPFVCYSVTKTVHFRRKVLAVDSVVSIVTDSWNYLRKTGEWKLLSFCIMPDHFHLLLVLASQSELSDLINRTNKFTAREINKCLSASGQFWQEGFHDHRCGTELEVDDLSIYIEHNPVRAGSLSSRKTGPTLQQMQVIIGYSTVNGMPKPASSSSASETPPTDDFIIE